MDDQGGLSPAERRMLGKAIRKAFGKGLEAGERAGYARGRDEAREMLAFAARLNGSTHTVLKAMGPAADEGEDPHELLAHAMVRHAHEALEAGEDPAPGLEALRALLDDPEGLARVLGDSGAGPGEVAKCVGPMLVRKAWDESKVNRDHGKFAHKASKAAHEVTGSLAEFAKYNPTEGHVSSEYTAPASEAHKNAREAHKAAKAGDLATAAEYHKDAAAAHEEAAEGHEGYAGGDVRHAEAARAHRKAAMAHREAHAAMTGGGGSTVRKAWDESKHPRSASGHFISRDKIEDAKGDPKLAAKLRAEVKPEDAGKLEDALKEGGDSPGRTKRGQARHEAGQRREAREASRARGEKVLAKLRRAGDLRGDLTADDLHDLADHLRGGHVTVGHLRELRRAMQGGLAARVGFGGAKDKAGMVDALAAHAGRHALEARMREQGVTGEDADAMRVAAGLTPKATPETPAIPVREKPVPTTGQLGAWGRAVEDARARAAGVGKSPAVAKEKRKRKYQDTVINKVKDFGGIDPNSHAFRTVYSGVKEAVENGIPLAVFKRGGGGLDSIAQQMQSGGYISVPDDKHATEHLLDLIRDRAKTHAADLTSQHDRDLEAYYKEREDAERAEAADPARIAEVVRLGEEAGRHEGEADTLEEHGEGLDAEIGDYDNIDDSDIPEGVNDSFDFGYNAPAAVAHPYDNASRDHTSDLEAIRPGESAYVGGHLVRRTADGSHQIETKGKYMTTDAAGADAAIRRTWANQSHERKAVDAALARHAGHTDPDPFANPVEGAEVARRRAAVPEGVRGVSLDEQTRGRTGVVKRDDEGAAKLVLDGGGEARASDFEPLNEIHSWRVPEKTAAPDRGLFDAPAPGTEPVRGGADGVGVPAPAAPPAFNPASGTDPDLRPFGPDRIRDVVAGRDFYGRPHTVYAVRGSGVQAANVVGVSDDSKTVTVRPVRFTTEQRQRMQEAGDDSLYDYKLPTGFIYPGRDQTRLKLQRELDNFIESATGVRPDRSVPGASVVELPKDAAGPSILDRLRGRDRTDTAAPAPEAPAAPEPAPVAAGPAKETPQTPAVDPIANSPGGDLPKPPVQVNKPAPQAAPVPLETPAKTQQQIADEITAARHARRGTQVGADDAKPTEDEIAAAMQPATPAPAPAPPKSEPAPDMAMLDQPADAVEPGTRTGDAVARKERRQEERHGTPPGREPEPQQAADENAAPGVLEKDVPYDVAYNAHRNSSFVPEKRAKQRQQEYVEQMNADWQHLSGLAKTPEQKEMLKEEFERYRQGYLNHKLAILHAASRTASSMITGPANFPVDRNRKRLETERKRIDDLIDFRKRAMNAIQRKVSPEDGPIRSSDAGAVDALKKQHADLSAMQEKMKAVNGIIRQHTNVERLDNFRGHNLNMKPGKTREQLVEALKGAGVPEKNIPDMLQPDELGRVGYPDYAIKNNNANIRRIQGRIEEVQRMKSGPHKEQEYTGGVKVVEDPEAGRIRIHYPGKPDRETIDALKGKGFRWSPSENAWQRHLNNGGRYAVDSLLASRGHTKVEGKPDATATEPDNVPPMLHEPEPEPDIPEAATPTGEPAPDMAMLDQPADAVGPGSRTGDAVARKEKRQAERSGTPPGKETIAQQTERMLDEAVKAPSNRPAVEVKPTTPGSVEGQKQDVADATERAAYLEKRLADMDAVGRFGGTSAAAKNQRAEIERELASLRKKIAPKPAKNQPSA